MNIQEFAALKAGDRLENPMTQSRGVVVEVTAAGVKVRWGDGTPGKDVTFTYTPQTTSWYHWQKADDAPAFDATSRETLDRDPPLP